MVIENLFIVAASGLAPAAVAFIGQAIGAGSIRSAKMHARMVLQLAAFAGLLFAVLLVGASFLLPALYPQVAKDVLRLAFWGLLIAALVQPAKVLNSAFGNGILPGGKDTKFILAAHLIASYLIGLPAAVLFGIFWGLSAWGVFSSLAMEEIVKAILFFLRFRSSAWCKNSLDFDD
jgi:Na+-driven multidrug efflux pump